MKRQTIYSAARRPAAAARPVPEAPRPAASAPVRMRSLRAIVGGRGWVMHVLIAVVVAGLLLGLYRGLRPAPELIQAQIDAAVLDTLENKRLPARAAKAAETVRPSVVLVRSFAQALPRRPAKPKPKSMFPEHGRRGADGRSHEPLALPEGLEEFGLGSGIVIVDDGTILTNLHVIRGARLVRVTFHDGMESDARVVGIHPENDLAVIKAATIPDDLPAATLGSAGRLKPGDEVVVVGFPFGIGPSVSAGVVSGLEREFRSPKGERVLTGLIQFDAAANPGNSGGPLVTMQGDVVGIVTAILNPTEAGTFVGIGFAVTIGAAGNAVGMHPF